MQYLTERDTSHAVEYGLLTSYDKWEDIKINQNVIGLIVDGSTRMGKSPPDFQGEILTLSVLHNSKHSNSIYKYQKADSIYQEILKRLKAMDIRSIQSMRAIETVIVFTPKRGKEGLYILANKEIGELGQGKRIYINLSSLPPDTKEIKDALHGDGSISDLILTLEEDAFDERVRENISALPQMDMIPPVRHYKDLFDIRSKDLLHLISRLHNECGYQTCYIECSELYEFTFPLFSFADRILVINYPEETWQDVMERYLKIESVRDFSDKIRWIDYQIPELGKSEEARECERKKIKWEGLV
ncbi:MAG: hypothetical protein LBR68_05730 [Lachnoclostridium sp.]|nr:hypothetical protein [Lachnoclostridium sp.]